MTTDVNDSRTSQKALDAVGKVSTGLFIDGQWCEAASGKRFDVVNPATEEVIATVADGGTEDAQRAVETAGRVQKDWAGTPPRARSERSARVARSRLSTRADPTNTTVS